MEILLPKAIAFCIQRLEENGFSAWCVGGCVRDAMLQRKPHDWDLCTNASTEQMCQIFSDHELATIGAKHGTIGILVDGMMVETTTYRIDGTYHDSRHPDSVQFTDDIAEDLKRRDFTINAMAYHPQRGILDLWNGKTDLGNHILRCVGEPNKRFQEDSLRILRGIRFAVGYQCTVDSDTLQAMQVEKERMQGLSAERCFEELQKLLGYEKPYLAWENPVFAELLQVVFPELENAETIANYLHKCEKKNRMAALVWSVFAEKRKQFLKRLFIPTKEKTQLMRVCAYDSSQLDLQIPQFHRLAVEITPTGMELLMQLLQLDTEDAVYQKGMELLEQLRAQQMPFSVGELAVNGKDLLAMGIPGGKQMGEILQKLLHDVVERKVTPDKASLLIQVQKYLGNL